MNVPTGIVRTYKVVEVEYEPRSYLFGLIRWDRVVSKDTIGSHIVAVLDANSIITHITVVKGDKEYTTKLD